MGSLRGLNRRIRNIMFWRSEYRKKKEIVKSMMLETEKAEAEIRYPKPQASHRRNVFKRCFCCFSG